MSVMASRTNGLTVCPSVIVSVDMLIERNGALLSISIRSSTMLFVTRASTLPWTLMVAMTVPTDPGSNARGIGLTPSARKAVWICAGVPEAV